MEEDSEHTKNRPVNLLFVGRYDIKHPKAGGAEKYVYQVAKRFVEHGYNVTWLSINSAELAVTEEVGGIKIIRKRLLFPTALHQYSEYLSLIVHLWKYYLQNNKNIDFVIEDTHALPLFSKFYVSKVKRINLIHEITGKIWYYMTPIIVAFFGSLFEKFIYKFLYRNERIVTVSESTKKDLIAYGVKAENINIAFNGVDFIDMDLNPSLDPTIIYFGGVRPLKQIEHQIEAVSLLRKDFPKLKLIILGNNNSKYAQILEKLIENLLLQDKVTFTGFVSENIKRELLASSWLTISTSIKEGWGQAVMEAAAHGIPAIVYTTHGNIDVVEHMQTGLHTIVNTPESLANAIKLLLLDTELRARLGTQAKERYKNQTWEKTFEEWRRVLLLS